MAKHGVCKVAKCDNTRIVARGFCDPHYRRFKAHGNPLAGRASNGEPLRFIQNVATKYEGKGCLEWPFSKMRGRYGHLQIDGRFHPAHRVVCEMVHGAPEIETMQAAHLCNNTSCVNPRHLRWATPQENSGHKAVHGTLRTGEQAPNTFLTEREVRAMLRLVDGGVKQNQVASAFGISKQRVNEIVLGKAWKYARPG